jgi:hypothetical protein
MPSVKRHYSRVYWEAVDDPKFADVWGDDHALAAWLRLLVAADMAWPARANVYHGIHRGALTTLCQSGLVDMQATGRFRIHGLDKEREARSSAASDAVRTRYARSTDASTSVGDESFVRSAETVPSKAEQSKDETSRVHRLPIPPGYGEARPPKPVRSTR